jgi:hypothetical protein
MDPKVIRNMLNEKAIYIPVVNAGIGMGHCIMISIVNKTAYSGKYFVSAMGGGSAIERDFNEKQYVYTPISELKLLSWKDSFLDLKNKMPSHFKKFAAKALSSSTKAQTDLLHAYREYSDPGHSKSNWIQHMMQWLMVSPS